MICDRQVTWQWQTCAQDCGRPALGCPEASCMAVHRVDQLTAWELAQVCVAEAPKRVQSTRRVRHWCGLSHLKVRQSAGVLHDLWGSTGTHTAMTDW